MVLLTDQAVPGAYKDRVNEKTQALQAFAPVEQVMAAVMRMGNFSTQNTVFFNPPRYEPKDAVNLWVLNPQQVQAIDCALKEVGEYGEVRLTIQRGHLRFLVKLRIEDLSEQES